MPRTRTYGLDIDTVRYAQRVKSGSGATILPEPLKQINKFVIGVKKLGLWNSMVCWPMRGIHNAGTGSTVYSLGGSGTYNGTMVNSPTWSQYGVQFATNTTTGRDRYVSVTWSTNGGYDIRSNSSVIVVSDFGEIVGAGNAQDQYLFGGGATANNRYGGTNTRSANESPGTNIQGPSNVGATNYATQSNQALAANTWRMWTTQRENNVAANSNVQGNRHFRDTTQIANGSNAAAGGRPPHEAIPNASEVLILGNGRGNTSLAPIGKIAFVSVIGNWQVDIPIVHTLYKRTLGIGLNLP